jgi:hypothetical protein
MADSNSFFKYEDHRAQTGYKAAILVKLQTANTYSLLVASETVPSIFGTQDSYEFDLLNSPTKGKVAGKMTLEDKEVEVLHHRDNVLRFEELKDKVLDFLYVDSQFVGYKFSGTIKYRVNDASADVLRGTYTITPISADPTPYLDVRSLVQETLCFEGTIPETVESGTVDITIVQAGTSSPTFAIKKYNATTRVWSSSTDLTASTTSGRSTLTIGESASGLYSITASLDGYASWTTTIYVE